MEDDQLPLTIRDAVELTRYLGVQYLWVDALCIIQDDTQDWLHESAQMATVYAKAFLTVSASSVPSSKFSFLHKSRGNSEVLFELPEKAASGRDFDNAAVYDSGTRPRMLAVQRTTLSGIHQSRHDDIIDPSMLRAWTLQEHLLSTRLISFSTDELQWTCRTLCACECGCPENCESPRLENLQRELDMVRRRRDVNCGEPMNTRNLEISICFDFWCGIVEAYCRRNLSWMRDKLPALSGVAHEFFQTLKKERLANQVSVQPLRYLAGLWNIEIHKGLMWASGKPTDGASETYRAPTWSWASVEGEVFCEALKHGS